MDLYINCTCGCHRCYGSTLLLGRKDAEKADGTKELEIYESFVELTEKEPFSIGLCYTDAVDTKAGRLMDYAHTVQFANDEIYFEEGINYFISYQYTEEGKTELVPVIIK